MNPSKYKMFYEKSRKSKGKGRGKKNLVAEYVQDHSNEVEEFLKKSEVYRSYSDASYDEEDASNATDDNYSVEEPSKVKSVKKKIFGPFFQVVHSALRPRAPRHSPTPRESFHFDEYYRMKNQAMPVPRLPIASFQKKILNTINTNQVTIITGSTGCGKTTQVPQYIMDYYAEKHWHCNIIVLQPRRVSAIAVAERVCAERGWPLGSLCGYKIGLINKMSEDTRLLYVTTGIFLQILLNDKNLHRFTHIFFDEIHERERDMDFSLMVVKKYLATNSPDCKLILMSATAECDRFAKFFSTKVNSNEQPAPVIEVDAPPLHEVEHFYLDDLKILGRLPCLDPGNPKVMTECLEFGIQLIAQFDVLDYKSEQKSAVLIFLPGLNDIEEMYNLINRQMESDCGETYKWQVLVLHGTIPPDEQQKAFRPALPGFRKIILSTNIAESSITIPDVSIVIDFCLTKFMMGNCKASTTKLVAHWASKANLTQRYGRVGRVGKGLVYRMITKSALENKIEDYNLPDMKRCLLEKLVLQTIYLGMGDPIKFLMNALDPPSESDIAKTLLLLKESGAIPINSSPHYTPDTLTMLGRLMAVMPLDIRHTRLVVLGFMYSVFKECIIMAACLANKSIIVNPFFDKMKAYQTKLTWANGSQSDCIALLNVYETWKRHHATGYFTKTRKNTEAEWASKWDVHLKGLYEVDKCVVELTQRFKKYGIEEIEGPQKVVWSDVEREFVLKVVLAGAFYPNYFYLPWDRSDTFEKAACNALHGRNAFTTAFLKSSASLRNTDDYEDKIKEFMSSCNENFKVSGNNDKCVFLEFERDKEPDIDPDIPFDPRVPGGVSLGVYKAFKMKFCGPGLELPLKKGNDESRKKKNEPASDVKKDEANSDDEYKLGKENIECDGPPISLKSFPVKISHIVNPGRFWCIAMTDRTKELEKELNKLLDSMLDDVEPFKKPPKVGQWCLVKSNDEHGDLFRGRIESVEILQKSWGAKVYLLDSGKTKFFKKGNIMKYILPVWKDIQKIPALAFECTLTKVKASPYLSPSGKWSPEATEEFKKVTKEGYLSVEVYSVVSGLTSVFLMKWISPDNPNFCINEHMIETDFAVERSENWLSEKSFRISKGEKFPPEWDDSFRPFGFGFSPAYWPSHVKFYGPTNPLSAVFYGCTESKTNCTVFISGQSVNSIVLNSESRDRFDRLMVAGTISQGQISTNLTVSETTIMPSIPGWSTLIPLVFAPAAEVRTNKTGTAYAGAICGLGLDPQGYTVLPENDIEMIFDTVITEEDLVDINRLRFASSAMLIAEFYDEKLCSNPDRLYLKKVIQECFRNLFLKKKNIKEGEEPATYLRWGSDPSPLRWAEDFLEDFDNAFMYRAYRPRKLSQTRDRVLLRKVEPYHNLITNRR